MEARMLPQHQSRSSQTAFCLVCKAPLWEPFPESEILTNRNTSLIQTFCEYLEVEGDCEVLSKEFPFCPNCKLTLIELKALDTEIFSLFSSIYSIKFKFTAKILESKDVRNWVSGEGAAFSKSSRFNNSSRGNEDLGSELELAGDVQTPNFSESVFKEVNGVRNSIFRRFDVSVNVTWKEKLRVAPVPDVRSEEKENNEVKRAEDFCQDSYTCREEEDVGEDVDEVAEMVEMDDFSPNEVSDADIDEDRDQDENDNGLNRELTPTPPAPSIVDTRRVPVDDTANKSSRSLLLAAQDEVSPRDLCLPEDSSATDVTEVSRNQSRKQDVQPTSADLKMTREEEMDSDFAEQLESDSDSSETDDDSERIPARALRNRTLPKSSKGKEEKKVESVGCTPSSEDNKCVTVSPGVFMFADKFQFEMKGGKYSCSSCGFVHRYLNRILRHLRIHATRSAAGKTMYSKLLKISASKWTYANEYEIETTDTDGVFSCKLCGMARKGKYKLIDHIRRVHIKNLPLRKSATENPKKLNVSLERGSNVEISSEFIDAERNSTAETNKSRKNSDPLPSDSRKQEVKSAYVSTRCKEISPGKWLYDDKFPFEKDGMIFRCGSDSCVDAVYRDLHKVTKHVRRFHVGKPSKKPRCRLREVAPHKFLYGGKYHITCTDGKFVCATCGLNRTSKYKIAAHIKEVHMNAGNKDSSNDGRKATLYICDICGKTLRTREGFRNHSYIHDDTGEHDLICEVCGKAFKCKRNLQKHLLLHTGAYECDFCGKKFPTENKLRGHRSTHTGEKSFKCDSCSQTFKTYKGMRLHGSLCKGKTSDKPIKDNESEEEVEFNLEAMFVV